MTQAIEAPADPLVAAARTRVVAQRGAVHAGLERLPGGEIASLRLGLHIERIMIYGMSTQPKTVAKPILKAANHQPSCGFRTMGTAGFATSPCRSVASLPSPCVAQGGPVIATIAAQLHRPALGSQLPFALPSSRGLTNGATISSASSSVAAVSRSERLASAA